MNSSREEQIEDNMRLGIEAFQHGELSQAITHFKATLALEPASEDKASCYQNLAGAYCTRGDLEEGIRCFETALTFDPDNSEILANLGLALKKSGDSEQALGVLTRALANDPWNIPARLTTAQVLRDVGKFEEAKMQFEAVIGEGTNERAMMIAQKEIKALEETTENARREKELSATGSPDTDFQYFADMGADAFNAGDYTEAIKHFQAALSRDPKPVTKKAALLQDLGVAYMSVGRSSEGIDLLKDALELDPDNADILKNYATALDISGEKEKASAVMTKAFSARLREGAQSIVAGFEAAQTHAPESVADHADVTVPPETSAEIEGRWKSAGKALLKEASKYLEQMAPNESKIVLAEIDKRNLGGLVSEETRGRITRGETQWDETTKGQVRSALWAFK